MTIKIPYFIAGDPDLDTTYRLLLHASKFAPAIALALPFSDPMAGSPLTQKAHVRALENLIHTKDIFKMLTKFKEEVNCPIIAELYFNQIFTYGIERFFHHAKQAGIQALSILDLPIEHENEVLPYASHCQITLLHTLTASKERLGLILSHSHHAILCFDVNAYQAIPSKYALLTLQEFHHLEDEIYADGIIIKEPIIDLVEVLSTNPQAENAVFSQIKAILNY